MVNVFGTGVPRPSWPTLVQDNCHGAPWLITSCFTYFITINPRKLAWHFTKPRPAKSTSHCWFCDLCRVSVTKSITCHLIQEIATKTSQNCYNLPSYTSHSCSLHLPSLPKSHTVDPTRWGRRESPTWRPHEQSPRRSAGWRAFRDVTEHVRQDSRKSTLFKYFDVTYNICDISTQNIFMMLFLYFFSLEIYAFKN